MFDFVHKLYIGLGFGLTPLTTELSETVRTLFHFLQPTGDNNSVAPQQHGSSHPGHTHSQVCMFLRGFIYRDF